MVTRKKALLGVLCLALLSASSVAQAAEPKLKTAKYLQDVAVTIKAGPYSGSGVMVQTKDGTTWVWTAAHVVAPLRSKRVVLDEKGTPHIKVEFEDAKVLQFRKNKEDGRIVSNFSLDAEVIRYSDSEYGHDLALLRVRDKEFKPKASAQFYLDKEMPEIGEELYHCGSPLGVFGSNSLTAGILSQHGRVIDGKIYDQTSCTVFPGSSGGCVALKSDGRYVGMLVAGAGEGFNLIVPVRRMASWASKTGVDFALDPTKEVPSDEKLHSRPVDDAEGATGAAEQCRKQSKELGLRFWLFDNTTPAKEQKGLTLDMSLIRIQK